ncbi:GNAT family N-acetyltransferase [Allohahella sp. A8]|uniref:GNAT family N-acetyltransferase n=1 Tax=Allohahella sp. A8 TaxID=3141461 RepID=UPI003A7FE04D
MDSQPQTITTRTATKNDAAEACLVLHRSIIELCQADHRAERALIEQWLANKTRENLSSWFTASELEGKVAIFDGSIVGVGLLHCEGEILLCYVLPEVVHQGVGKALLNSMIESGKRLGVQTSSLRVRQWRVRFTSVMASFHLVLQHHGVASWATLWRNR